MTSKLRSVTPPTSTPKEIYLSLLAEVSRGDRHSLKVAKLREGLVRGAEIRHGKALISDKELFEIKQVVTLAESRDFRPLLYVISYPKVKHLVRAVPIEDRAHPLSQEYVIEELETSSFEALDLA